MAGPGARKGKPLPAGHKLTPTELAKEVAGRLAAKESSRRGRFFHQSVFLGRLVSGLLVLTVSAALLSSLLAGFDRLVSSAPRSILDKAPSAEGPVDGSTFPVEVAGISLANTSTTMPPPFALSEPGLLLPGLPATTTTVGAGVSAGTGDPPTTDATPRSSSPTSPATSATTTPTTPITTTAPATTSTTAGTTTTTTTPPPTSTTLSTTATTICCIRGGGQGCLPPPQCP